MNCAYLHATDLLFLGPRVRRCSKAGSQWRQQLLPSHGVAYTAFRSVVDIVVHLSMWPLFCSYDCNLLPQMNLCLCFFPVAACLSYSLLLPATVAGNHQGDEAICVPRTRTRKLRTRKTRNAMLSLRSGSECQKRDESSRKHEATIYDTVPAIVSNSFTFISSLTHMLLRKRSFKAGSEVQDV